MLETLRRDPSADLAVEHHTGAAGTVAQAIDLVQGKSAIGRGLLEIDAEQPPGVVGESRTAHGLTGLRLADLNAVTPWPGPVIRIHASHGYAVVKLREFMNRDGSVRLDLQFRGSLDALASLSHKNCDLAGFHVPEGKLGERTVGQYGRWLRPQTQRLIYFASRCQGLMLTQGNPKGISDIVNLASPDIRFVNRQPGSGTRVMFDQLLEQAGIDPQRIPGYQDEEFTHAAVAAFVASGMADVGFGVEAAARQFKLDFIPVAGEQYLLACHQETLLQPAIQSMLALLQSAEFKNAVNALPGYDGTRAGEVITIDQVFPWLESKDRSSAR